MGSSQTSQRGGRLLGTILLNETDHRVQDYYSNDSDAVYGFAQCCGNRRCANQHPNNQTFKLAYKNDQGREALALA